MRNHLLLGTLWVLTTLAAANSGAAQDGSSEKDNNVQMSAILMAATQVCHLDIDLLKASGIAEERAIKSIGNKDEAYKRMSASLYFVIEHAANNNGKVCEGAYAIAKSLLGDR